MQKKIKAVILIIIFLIIFDLLALNNKSLTLKIESFSKQNGAVSVVVINNDSADIEFIYNKKIANSLFCPGSLMKVFTAAVLLENNTRLNFDKEKKVLCEGKYYPITYQFSNEDFRKYNLPFDTSQNSNYFKCSLVKGHGAVNLFDAIVHSCNVYFLKSVDENPEYVFNKIIDLCRLGKFKNIKGNIKSPVSKFDFKAACIGEGGNIRMTPLQTAYIFSAFFSDKYIFYKSHKDNSTKKIGSLNISPSNVRFIFNAMTHVVSNGTMKKLKLNKKNIELVAAKTGSGTIYNRKYATNGWNVVNFKYRGNSFTLVSFVRKGSGSKQALSLSKLVLENIKL